MARHETEMHQQRRELVAYVRELLDRRVIHWRDVPAHIRAIVVAGKPQYDTGLFADRSQFDLADRKDV
jgi:hypothetical protein